MIELGQKEIRGIQCEVMRNAHDFMAEHGLKYSLACGTLLGAVRHRGYIPWDDDIDIYMLRSDYNKLISIFPESYRTHYKLVSYERNNGWCRVYANLYDDRTIWQEEKSKKEMTIGVNIDIFPVDNVPDNPQEWKIFNKKRRLLIYLWAAKFTTLRLKNRSFVKLIVILFLKLLLLCVSMRWLLRYIDSYIQKYNSIDTTRLFENSCGIIQKEPFKKEDFNETVLMPFEGYQFMAMKGFEDYLTNGFGDYMRLPPMEKRIPHHYFKAYWKEG